MSEITFYRVLYIASLLMGIAVPLVTAVRVALVYAGMAGLMGDQVLEHQRWLRDLDESNRQQEQQTGPPPSAMPGPDLNRPALPEEGY
jgi:hypothetical protein